MKLYPICFYLLFFVLLSFGTRAQEKIVHGMVTTFDSIPLVNVEIKVQSTKQIFTSDTLGQFSVACNLSDKLKVTADGFLKQSVNVIKQTKFIAVNLILKEGPKARQHAIGYASIADRDKLTSIASLNSDDLDFSKYATMSDLIRGKFASVQIVNGEVVIRGIKTSGNNGALIVVNGISRNASVLSALSPAQVKSINIIKDGTSSIYGVRGANGVLVIEMKK